MFTCWSPCTVFSLVEIIVLLATSVLLLAISTNNLSAVAKWNKCSSGMQLVISMEQNKKQNFHSPIFSGTKPIERQGRGNHTQCLRTWRCLDNVVQWCSPPCRHLQLLYSLCAAGIAFLGACRCLRWRSAPPFLGPKSSETWTLP
jgi:hypothetical protein